MKVWRRGSEELFYKGGSPTWRHLQPSSSSSSSFSSLMFSFYFCFVIGLNMF